MILIATGGKPQAFDAGSSGTGERFDVGAAKVSRLPLHGI
jgi:hypothetical protein